MAARGRAARGPAGAGGRHDAPGAGSPRGDRPRRRPWTEPSDDDLGPALHAEIDRLPEKYRAPIVLCYLQGQTIDEASRQLGWPAGTVGGRLARARDRLRDRLVQQGLVAPQPWLTALAPDTVLGGGRTTGAGPCPPRNAALQLAAGRPATAVVSAVVANLLEQTVRSHDMDQVDDRCRDLWTARDPDDRGCRDEPDGRCRR